MKIKWIYKIILLVFVFCEVQVYGQTVIIREEVPENFEDEDNDIGPNRRSYSHPFMEYSLNTGGYDHSDRVLAEIKGFRSFGIASGYRTFVNLNKIISLTLDTRFDYNQYSISNPSDSLIMLPVVNTNLKRARYFFFKYGLSGGLQFNLKPNRGNQLGKFIKLGGMANIHILQRFGAKYNSDNAQVAKYEKVTLTSLRFVRRWSYSLEAGYGNTFVYLFARYRPSNFMKSREMIPVFRELPRLTFGFQFYTSGI